MTEPRLERDTVPLGTPTTGSALHWIQRLATGRGIVALAVASLVLLILAGVGVWYTLQIQPLESTPEPELTPPASLSELATEFPELGEILLDPALDSAYKDFLLAYQQGGDEAALELALKYGLVNENDELRITLELDTTETEPLVEELELRGIKVTAVSDNLMDIAVPLELIEQALLAGDPGSLFENMLLLEHIVRIRLPRGSIQHMGDVEIESLGVINADAWQEAGFTGKGLKIGVLDLGFNKYRSLLGTELPAEVKVRSFISGVDADESDTVHGTAVAEIIHDIAPDAELFFAAYDTDTEQRLAADWLVSQGVNIISHSAGSIFGPMDGSGPEARMVDRIAAGGVLWVNSAGNMAESHYRGTFTDEDGDGFHEFSPEDELMGFSPQGRSSMALNWDAWDSGDQDLDLLVLDKDMNRIVSSENLQNGPGDEAGEFITYVFFDRGPYYIAIRANQVTRPVVVDFYIYNAKRLEYPTPGYSITTPADARGALTVAATFWSDDVLEEYSSNGPSHDGRPKPDISAPTGVQSAAYGEEFFGTSAAAPHVSGSAALVWQAFPWFTAQQVADFLKEHAKDLGPAGVDTQFGHGRLWLGEVPPIGVLPTATATQGAGLLPSPTVLEPLNTPTRTATSTLPPTQAFAATHTPTLAPVTGTSSAAVWLLPLAVVSCVAIPGLLGLGGLALLGVALYYRSQRARRTTRRSVPRRSPVGARPMSRPPVGTPPTGSPRPAYPVRQDYPVGQASYPARPDYGAGAPMQVRCANCGTFSRPGVRFCRACGTALGTTPPRSASPQAYEPAPPADHAPRSLQTRPAYCTRCGRRLRPTSKFCPGCGKQLG